MNSEEKRKAYEDAEKELHALLSDESDMILKMATINAILKKHLPYYFWVGFYFVRDEALHIGPYQGTLGCLHIPFEKGVCGAAARERRTQVVQNVHEFPGHIACDSASESEIVVPVYNADKELIAVFDVDSTTQGSFDELDKEHLESLLKHHFAVLPLSLS